MSKKKRMRKFRALLVAYIAAIDSYRAFVQSDRPNIDGTIQLVRDAECELFAFVRGLM